MDDRTFLKLFFYCLIFGNHIALLSLVVSIVILVFAFSFGCTIQAVLLGILSSIPFFMCLSLNISTMKTFNAMCSLLTDQNRTRRDKARRIIRVRRTFGYCGHRGLALAMKHHKL